METPAKCIGVDDARSLQDKWVDTRGKEIQEAQGYKDTREFWMSVEELQEYLDYVKEKSKEQGVDKPGIRVYLGAYAETEKRKSYSTLFLAPTKEKGSEEESLDGEATGENNYDIEPLNTISGGWPPIGY